ncbi:hypothetical protein [Geobacter sp. DSM 9736]|uniref:hypothetical protein n=1 Tax=Geobacter sp. DSM 9736 TaxID=1277350 RepID=UPI000B5E85E3|nr:hypothetical protein [Geobacter sp. DSM 9736]SNB45290.1 hypothetical protein SAMN06269301_0697 [Geobacter sp. DSM 9736]
MKKGIFLTLFMSLIALAAGCGGGGGGGGGGGATTTISGTPFKGPFVSGTVNVYDVSGGITTSGRQLLGTGAINSDGSYTITIPATSNPVMVEVVGGSYKDETSPTGALVALATPLRAVIPSGASNASVAVTPFTELATQRAAVATTSIPAAITEANQKVSLLYQVPDIISTTPIDPSVAFPSGSLASSKNYGIALAAVSQLAKTQGSLAAALNRLSVNSGTISDVAAAEFTTALTTFLTSQQNANSATVPSLDATPFRNVGSQVAVTLQPQKTRAIANGADSVTMTASLSPAVPDNSEVTFSITSGNAVFSNGQNSIKAGTAGSAAAATITATAAGAVTVNATYLPGISGNSTVTFVIPTVSISASPNAALPNGTNRITLTATVASGVPEVTTVSFAVSSGTATLVTPATVTLVNGVASVDVVSSTPGDVTVAVTYAPGVSSSATIKFATPAKAVVTLALKQTRNNVRFLDLNLDHSPASGATYSSNRTLNSDMNVFGVFPSAATLRVNILRSSGVTGFNASAGTPFVEFTYDITGNVPVFSISNAVLGLFNPATPDVSTEVPLTTDDFNISVSFLDAQGNPL